MEKGYRLLPAVLSAAIKDRALPVNVQHEDLAGLFKAARDHNVQALVAEALWKSGTVDRKELPRFLIGARKSVVAQAQRTGSFLLFYSRLLEQGLAPAVLKGIVCRDLYPIPEQRPSVDEDLLILPEEFTSVDSALREYGLVPETDEDPDEIPDERTYSGTDGSICIELHTAPFSSDNAAYEDLNSLFDGVMDRTVWVRIQNVSIRTLEPTDHLLYLICHAYKHFLHAGVGIRQVCDICLMAEKYANEIRWETIYEKCRSVRLNRFAAGLFRIGEKHLGFAMPKVFAEIDVDESALLEDILTGGLYGVSDIDRAHSAAITLNAVSAEKQGRRSHGLLAAVFPRAISLEERFPYLKKRPWLLPVAWGQRITRYLTHRNPRPDTDPARSMAIGKQRTELLRQYGIID